MHVIAVEDLAEALNHLSAFRDRQGGARGFGSQASDAVGVADGGVKWILAKAGQASGQAAAEGITGTGGIAGRDGFSGNPVVRSLVAPTAALVVRDENPGRTQSDHDAGHGQVPGQVV